MSNDKLSGKLVFAGDLNVEGEELSGCFVHMDRATLIAAKSLPMYEMVVIASTEKDASDTQDVRILIEALSALAEPCTRADYTASELDSVVRGIAKKALADFTNNASHQPPDEGGLAG
jgi:hypothetical protein